jgi:hypothetical protein
MQWSFSSLPGWIRWLFTVGCFLVSAFSSQLPAALQTVGLCAGLLLGAFSGLASAWHAINTWRVRHGKPSVKVEPVHLIILGLAISAAGVIWLAVWQPKAVIASTPPIVTQGNADPGPLEWYKAFSMEGGPRAGRNIIALKFHGRNISEAEVELKSASLISAINGTKMALEIDVGNETVPIDQIGLVPKHAYITLTAKFGSPDPSNPGKVMGLEPEAFLETWRQFSLNVQDDKKSYRIEFNEENLAGYFTGTVGPHVTKKKSSREARRKVMPGKRQLPDDPNPETEARFERLLRSMATPVLQKRSEGSQASDGESDGDCDDTQTPKDISEDAS